MAKSIEPNLKKIIDYLRLKKNDTFVIPEYQRAYSWEIKQCDKLWQDIEDFIDNEGTDPYFFGTIIINCQEDNSHLSLIDGQQRTTTFILLLKAVLVRLNEAVEETSADKDSRGLTRSLEMKRDRIIKILYKVTDNEIYDILEDFENFEIEKILENNSINELYKDELNTILRSSNFEDAEEKVVKIPYKHKDNKYTNYFRNYKFFTEKLSELSPSKLNNFTDCFLEKAEVIEIRSWNVEQAITMFNSLNSDGMPLLDADIISAKLYSNSGDEREDFNKRWAELKNIVSTLEQKKVADIDDILMQYMYIKRASDKDYVSESGAISVTTPGLRRYYTEVDKDLLNEPIKLTAKFLKIAKIWERIKDFPITQLCFKFNENLKTYLISYLFDFEIDEITESLVIDFAEYLLKLFAILELVDIGYSSSKFKTFLFSLNTKLVDKDVEIETIKKEMSEHISKQWNKDDILDLALEYNKNALVYLNEYISCKEKSQKFILPEKYEIEHIMPRSGKNIYQIREDANLEDNEEFKTVVNSLGNKILLEENINRSIGNAWFRTKIQNSVKDKKGYKDSIFSLASNMLEEYEDREEKIWNKEQIKIHTEYSAERISNFIFE